MAEKDNPGKGNPGVQPILDALENMRKENDERFGELEHKVEGVQGDGADRLRMVNLFYDTDKKHILELSNISPASVRPFATALTLASILKPEVQSGEVSLDEVFIENFLRLRRSAHGKHFGLGLRALEEQMSATQQEGAEGQELG